MYWYGKVMGEVFDFVVEGEIVVMCGCVDLSDEFCWI